MGENSKIEWTDHTFNPWRGCAKIAAGCAHCYADKQAKRNPGTLGIWGEDGTRVLASQAMWKEPIKWNRDAEAAGVRRRVFCASMADVFEDFGRYMHDHHGDELVADEEPPAAGFTMNDARRRLFKLIDATPHLDWLLLTKRPENIRRMWPCENDNNGDGDCWVCSKGGLSCKRRRANVWLGTSIATQEDADKNIPELLKCRDLSPVLFLSMEPLLGPVDLLIHGECSAWHCSSCGSRNVSDANYSEDGAWWACNDCDYQDHGEPNWKPLLDWVICGGESGPGARPMHPAWVRSIRDQCEAAGVPFFFKQWGEFTSPEQLDEDAFMAWEHHATSGQKETDVMRFGKKFCGRLLDGREWNEMPQVEARAS